MVKSLKKKKSEEMEDVILECVRDYINKAGLHFRIEKINKINKGRNSNYGDGGVFFVNLKNKNNQNLSIVAKKYSKRVSRYLLLYNPLKRKFNVPFKRGRVSVRNLNHISESIGIIKNNGVDLYPYLYIDNSKRVALREMIEGVAGLKEAFGEDPQKTSQLLYQAGLSLGKLHGTGYVFGDFKPDHIVFDFERNRIGLIDYENIRRARSDNDYVGDLNNKFKFYFILDIPAEWLQIMWSSFEWGYLNSNWVRAEETLLKVKFPHKCCFILKFFIRVFRELNLFVRNLSKGYVKL